MVEQAIYDVVKKLGNNVEIRKYPEQIVAKTPMVGMNGSFGAIAGYIFGGNASSKEIAMTAPVVTNKLEMYFFMPKEYGLKKLPKPKSGVVKISKLPARMVAALRFSGFWTEGTIKNNESRLISELAKNGYAAIGAPYLMRYDPPWQLPFLRRNEVAVLVKKR